MELSINVFVTLDGVMQGPGGVEEDTSDGFAAGGWLVPLAEGMDTAIGDAWFANTDAILLGRTTFELMKPYWTAVTDPQNETATALNTVPKFVVSNTLTDPDWGDTTVISGDVVEQVRELKGRPGGEIQVHGSWRLVRALHDAGLVDIYRLLIFPVVVGAGKRLFSEGSTPRAFEVVERRATSAGATYLVLRPRDFAVGTFTVTEGKESVA
jgi:dihydrofolate reductase